ncbi:LuxR C-terminal-related transcriptional regulator [Actinocrinis sp.]|uniref:LuxR C-terminal-related transcriptional regulator n=1 Tax=Actinocrinis sp. TaxID=1920516 RepID=UPI002D6904B5|nr:LuxR C-terminal-related transcriptional regulator [Actinocrinis sp.]HZP54976.1 LuxR C-terminal-related transcriptional regulator [Actinocrinis sp.]
MSAAVLFSDAPPAATLMSPLERQVLDLLADGLSDPAIAVRLEVATSSVKDALGRLSGRLNTRERAAMVAAGYKQGVLAPPASVPDGAGKVTRREFECLLLIAQGLNAVGIADRWGLPVGDVRRMTAELRQRLGACSRTHLVRRAVELGVLTLVRRERAA